MAKTINTRIQHKFDSRANWDNATFPPLKGELLIYSDGVDANSKSPAFKVGDGNKAIGDLPFVFDFLRKGKGENSLVQPSRITNVAVSEGSVSFGEGSIAGSLGYYFDYIYGYTEKGVKKGKIQLCKTPPDQIRISLESRSQGFYYNTDTLFEVSGYEVGNKINIDCGNHYKQFGEIVDIEDNIITFIGDVELFRNDMQSKVNSGTVISFGGGDGGDDYAMKDPGYDDYTFSVVEHPNVGLVEVAKTAVAIGTNARATGLGAYAEGRDTLAFGNYGHTENRDTKAGYCAHAEGRNTRALANNSHTEGSDTEATGVAAHAEGRMTEAKGDYAHAQGRKAVAEGVASFAGGVETLAKGEGAMAHGRYAEALGDYSLAVGIGVVANATGAVALGWSDLDKGIKTVANARGAIATGVTTRANGIGSSSFGIETVAESKASFTAGIGTVAKEDAQASFGQYNAEDSDAVVIFGNGTDDNNRSNSGAVTKHGFKLSEHQFGTKDVQEGDYLPYGVFYFVYDKNIKFTLDAAKYTVDDEMIWNDWVETVGKDVGFGFTEEGVVTYTAEDDNGVKCVEDSEGNVVWSEDRIKINEVYTSGHVNTQAYGQKVFVADSSSYMGDVKDFSFSKIGNYGFDENYIKRISSNDVFKEIASRVVAGAAIYNSDSTQYYNVTELSDVTETKVSKLTYFTSYTDNYLYLGIEDDASATWIEEDGSENFISRNNYNIRIGLDKNDYSKCLVALIGANKGAGTANTDVFTLKAYNSIKTVSYGVDDHNVITNMAIMKRTFDEYGKPVGGTSSNIVSSSPYIAYIRYEFNKDEMLNMWNTAFGASLTKFPNEIYIAVSCSAYDKTGKTVVSTPFYGSVLSKPQMDQLMPTTITSGYTRQCPVLPHIIKIKLETVTFIISGAELGIDDRTFTVAEGTTWAEWAETTNGMFWISEFGVHDDLNGGRVYDSSYNDVFGGDVIQPTTYIAG